MKSVPVDRINAHVWRKQGLHRDDGDTATGLLGRVFGFYGTSPTCHLSLAARLKSYRPDELDRLLYPRRSAARIRAMRSSLFLVPKKWLPLAFQATRDVTMPAFRAIVEKSGVCTRAYASAAKRIEKLLEGREMTVAEIRESRGAGTPQVRRALGFVVALMCAEGRLVRARIRGGWRSDLFEYALLCEWLADVELDALGPQEARAQLARRYFGSYGPATAKDFHWWSGLTKTDAEQALADIRGRLIPLSCQGEDGLLLPKREQDLLFSARGSPRGVRLLPVWDHYLMGYRGRGRLLEPQREGYAYDRGGNATSVVLADGRVGGLWEMQSEGDLLTVKVALWTKAPVETWRAIATESRLLAEAFGFSDAVVFRCPLPRPFAGNERRLHCPLKGISGDRVRLPRRRTRKK